MASPGIGPRLCGSIVLSNREGRMKFLLAAAVSLALVACTKPNPEVCCVSADDCSAIGVSDSSRDCARGLTCQDHSCVVPTCTTSADCSGTAPVCNDGVCVACNTANACADGQVCEMGSGACVGCVSDADCSTAQPICDMSTNSCRTCALDSECSSGACGDDGTCIRDSAVAYVDPLGSDAGNCDHDAPCQSVAGAALKTNDARPHIVMTKASYAGPILVRVDAATASHITIHGSGSSVQCAEGFDGTCVNLGKAVTVRDLAVAALGGDGVNLSSTEPSALVDVSIESAKNGLTPGLITVLTRVDIAAGLFGILANDGEQITYDRGTISGGTSAIRSVGGGPTIQFSNLLIFGTSDRAVDLQNGSGAISFSTIADSGASTGTGGKAVECSPGMTISNSIVWVPGGSRPAVENCNVQSSIIGPIGIAGGMDVDPKFIAPAAHDYHISSDSPAVDQVVTGPDVDFEGDHRPQGARFDIGADEAKR